MPHKVPPSLAALAACLVLLCGCAPAAPAVPKGITFERIAYGREPAQFGELTLPGGPGQGPYPVAVLVHGGCWLADVSGMESMRPMAAMLRQRGFAVWNFEYARLGSGDVGGYPRTFTDLAHGVDYLRTLKARYPLDLDRVVLVGFSAGGHLVLWAGARGGLPAGSPLASADPLKPKGIVSLAGVTDLEAFRDGPGAACGSTPVAQALVAGAPGPDPFAQTSPIRMAPTGVRTVVVSGDKDAIVPASLGAAYAARAKGLGEPVEVVVLPQTDHLDMIDPQSRAWNAIGDLIASQAN